MFTRCAHHVRIVCAISDKMETTCIKQGTTGNFYDTFTRSEQVETCVSEALRQTYQYMYGTKSEVAST